MIFLKNVPVFIKTNINNSLTPLPSLAWYYTGFCHSDGSLFISIEKKAKGVWGFRLNPMFAITLEIGSLKLIQDIARFFGCGSIIITKQSATFRVTSFFHIWHIIIPHFLKYPFVGRKFLVFKIFVICCSLMLPFYHKTLPYSIIFRIIYLSFLMNEGTKRSLKDLQLMLLTINAKAPSSTKKFNNGFFSLLTNKALSINNLPSEFNILPANFSLINPYNYIELTYILGIFEGDGSFFIRFKSSPYIYSFGFNITTSIDDLPVLILIKNRLGCGTIKIQDTWCRLDINSIEELNNIIIPLVDSLQNYRGTDQGLLSHKAKNYSIWKEGIKKHLNNEFSFKTSNSIEEKELKKNALKIFIIRAYNIHNDGKKRKYTLNEFLELHGLN